jgi:hypothetical protein
MIAQSLSANPIWDRLPTRPTCGYGLSRLTARHGLSPIVKIRRSSDDATLDIAARGDGGFDAVAFDAFVGGGTGYIDTWYDQFGTNHLVQASTSAQPQMFTTSGPGSTPQIYGDGSNDILVTGSAVQPTNAAIYTVNESAGSQSKRFFAIDESGWVGEAWGVAQVTNAYEWYSYQTAGIAGPAATATGTWGTSPQTAAFEADVSIPRARIWVDGASIHDSAGPTGSTNALLYNAPSLLYVFGDQRGTYWNGYISEFVVVPTPLNTLTQYWHRFKKAPYQL